MRRNLRHYTSTDASARNRAVGRRNQRAGKDAEAIVARKLAAIGCLQVCPIETGFRLVAGKRIPKAKVAGDIRAVIPPSGRSVLVEVKHRADRLCWSDLEKHQHGRLMEHHQAGGLSIVALVHARGVALLEYPQPGWGPGRSIKADHADAIQLRGPLAG